MNADTVLVGDGGRGEESEGGNMWERGARECVRSSASLCMFVCARVCLHCVCVREICLMCERPGDSGKKSLVNRMQQHYLRWRQAGENQQIIYSRCCIPKSEKSMKPESLSDKQHHLSITCCKYAANNKQQIIKYKFYTLHITVNKLSYQTVCHHFIIVHLTVSRHQLSPFRMILPCIFTPHHYIPRVIKVDHNYLRIQKSNFLMTVVFELGCLLPVVAVDRPWLVFIISDIVQTK